MVPCRMKLPLRRSPDLADHKSHAHRDPRPSASRLFSATCALPKLEDLQPSHSNPLAHSLEKHGGVPQTVPIWNSPSDSPRSASRPLLLFWTADKAPSARTCPLA